MKGANVFVDTNIIVYAYDASAGEKHRKALAIMENIWDAGHGIVSSQVLEEFFVSVTRKIARPMETSKAREIVKDLLKWKVVAVDGELILEAIDIHQRYKYSFWDCMIIQAAIQGGAGLLFSEDLSDGQTIGGVKIKNPFK